MQKSLNHYRDRHEKIIHVIIGFSMCSAVSVQCGESDSDEGFSGQLSSRDIAILIRESSQSETATSSSSESECVFSNSTPEDSREQENVDVEQSIVRCCNNADGRHYSCKTKYEIFVVFVLVMAGTIYFGFFKDLT